MRIADCAGCRRNLRVDIRNTFNERSAKRSRSLVQRAIIRFLFLRSGPQEGSRREASPKKVAGFKLLIHKGKPNLGLTIVN